MESHQVLYYLICIYIPYVSSKKCQDKNISYHDVKNGYRHRLTFLKRGDLKIQGLISITDSPEDRFRDFYCNKITRFGLLRSYALRYAIDQVNEDTNLFPYHSVGLQIDNVCASLPATMSRAMEIISQHRPSVCRQDFLKCDSNNRVTDNDNKPAVGIVGTGNSFSSIPLASLMSLYSIPLVSYAASSKLLSNKNNYTSFFRTMPSDTHQIKAVLDVIKAFRWNYVIAIGSDDDYGRESINDLKKNAKDICIVNASYIPYNSDKTNSVVDSVLKTIKKSKNAEVIILFCYVKDLGDRILKKAHELNMKRVWLTSDLWNPSATDLSKNLHTQAVGILTISIKSYPMNDLLDYIRKKIKDEWECDDWLQNYMEKSLYCKPNKADKDLKIFSGYKCAVSMKTLMGELSPISGEIFNIVNSVKALVHAIHAYFDRNCKSPRSCSSNIHLSELTKLLYNVSFKSEDETISFDKNGDPKYAFYSVENLQLINGRLEYIKVGNWTNKDGNVSLMIEKDRIKWPNWFNLTNTTKKHPFSRCNRDCEPGEFVIERDGCCWKCKKCKGNFYTNKINAMNCSDCGLYRHTLDNKKCLLTNVKWLTHNSAPGKALVVISAFGFVLAIIGSSTLLKYWKYAMIGDNTPHLTTLYCFMLFTSFAYGALHIFRPSELLCSSMSAIFYLLLMMYISVLIIQTRFWNEYVVDGVTKFLKGDKFRTQMVSLIGYILVETATVIAWLHNEGNQVVDYKDNSHGDFLVWTQCRIETTSPRYISTFVPIIILIIATFCSFRERNREHCFHEPKFISFSCIALCVVIVAYLPTFQFVDQKYKSIIMAISVNIFGCTYISCFIIPKIFVGIMRSKRGVGLYPSRPGTERKIETEVHENANTEKSQSPSFNSETKDESINSSANGSKGQEISHETDSVTKNDEVDKPHDNKNTVKSSKI